MNLFISAYVSRYKYFVIVFAVIFQVLLLRTFRFKNHRALHPDAESSIRRAKTEACRKELVNLAHDLTPYRYVTGTYLIRSCPHDIIGPRVYRIGYITNLTGLVYLETPIDLIKDLGTCLDSCFSYGHSHGGWDESNQRCYCGDDESENLGIRSNACEESGQIGWYRVNDGIYIPFKSDRHASSRPHYRNPAKIAFLLSLSGRSVLQIRRLLKLIYSKRHIYYIHVDRRRDYLYNQLLPLQDEHDNIIITCDRYNTIWGGPSLLTMILKAFNDLKSRQWDYILNLSESDFPLKSLDALENYLSTNLGNIFLKTHNMRGYNFTRKQGLDKTFYQCDDHVWRLGDRSLPRGIIYSGGSDWFALPREFCDYLTMNIGKDDLATKLYMLFNHTLLPAESYFHTMAINSRFCDRFVDNNLRYTNWRRKQGCKCQHKNVVDWCGCSPLVFRQNDFIRLKKTHLIESLHFARKFDPTLDSYIINEIESQLVDKTQPVDNQTNYWLNVYHRGDSDSNRVREIYEGIVSLAYQSISKELQPIQTLESVDLYFENNLFAGYVFKCCNSKNCVEILVERNSSNHLKDFDYECLGLGNKRLQAIEVGHGFDTSERAFRDYSPLDEYSELVVYHEWLVQDVLSNPIDKIRFSLYNPSGRLVLNQDAKLKSSPKLTRLSLAHRLNTRAQKQVGRWSLMVSRGERRCLTYEFLVLPRTNISTKIDLKDFDRFYTVTTWRDCEVNQTETNIRDCSGWTLAHKEKLLRKFKLND